MYKSADTLRHAKISKKKNVLEFFLLYFVVFHIFKNCFLEIVAGSLGIINTCLWKIS